MDAQVVLMFIRAFVSILIFVLTGCSGTSDSLIGLLPGREVEIPRVDSGYDQAIRSLPIPEGKALIYLYQSGDIGLLKSSDAFINGDGMGRIFAGTYLYAVIEPGKVRLKVTRQMLYSDRSQSHPIAYHNAWGEFVALPNQRYFVELINELDPLGNDTGYEGNVGQTYRLGINSEQITKSKFSSLELSFQNRYDSDERGFPKYKTIDFCPYGALEAQRHEPVPCTFTKSF